MKKWLQTACTVLGAGMLLMFASCDSAPVEGTPEAAIHHAVDAISRADVETANAWMDFDSLLQETEGTAEEKESLELLFSKLSCQTKDSKIDGDKATVTTDIRNIDLQKVFTDYVAKALEMSMEEENELSDEELQAKLEELLDEMMKEEDELVTTTVEIQLTKKGENWWIETSEELHNALLGGMLESLESSDSSDTQSS